MSDNKKYYYLKLKDNFFETDEMVVLESMQDGYKYSNILLKLYLRSLRNDGKLMLNERIPFNSTMLSSVTRHSVGDIEKAIKLFKELKLIEVLDNGAIYMSDIQNFIGLSSTEGDRKRKYRKKIDEEKLLESGQMSDNRPPELEIELEREIELKKKLNKKIDYSNHGNVNVEVAEEWFEYKNYKTQAPITKTLNFLNKYPPNIQQQIVDNSIMNGYKGLFEPKSKITESKSLHQRNTEFMDSYFRSKDNSDAIIVEVG